LCVSEYARFCFIALEIKVGSAERAYTKQKKSDREKERERERERRSKS
jgi:hypothetical protein